MSLPSFRVYNASAGSGKTHTLVKEYLTILLADDFAYHFKNILAVTFTNKAVSEMKARIVTHLQDFSDAMIIEKPSAMAIMLCDALDIDTETLYRRAKKTLKYILHNYAFFDVVTIDTFNHRILRTFAYDLRIPAHFEVILDTKSTLEEAVDRLIHKAGEDELLTKVLVNFALEKADDDRSWDIALDLNKIAQLLLEENHYEHTDRLKGKTLRDFTDLSSSLKSTFKKEEHLIKTVARQVLKRIDDAGLEATDFSRGTLPNHFKKIASGDFNNLYANTLEKNLQEGNVYTKKLPEEKALRIDALLPELSEAYQKLKKAVFNVKFLKNFYKNIVPLSLLNAINNELEMLKEAQNMVLISEFNHIISKAIAKQPAPFIYERLGEKYHHYFIDEFQDTSQMQWENLIPLIGNALEGETLHGKRGTLCIVGDTKQAIYRWRGGKPEQFMALCNGGNPFQVEKEVISLPKNYRSFDEIVMFTNDFFHHIASFLTHPGYREVYRDKSAQNVNGKKGGSVTVDFIEKEADEEQYCKKVLAAIHETIQQGFAYNDICILTRKKKEGVLIASYLLEQGITIVSSETLVLKNSPKIHFLIHLIQHFLQPYNKTHRIKILHFLAIKENIAEKHDFFSAFLNDFNAVLKTYDFDKSVFLQLSFYDAVAYAIRAFDLADASDAYLQYFMDEVMHFMLKKGGDMSDFIRYWEKKKDALSIVAPQLPEAVQIMTIHKSKGLEFPVVIYPFANSYIYEEQHPKVWFPVAEGRYGISYALLNKNKDFREFNAYASQCYDDLQSKLELDQFNILYVALTRAVKKLYVITKKDLDNNGKEKQSYFSGLFIDYLKTKQVWDEEKSVYAFGKTTPSLLQKEDEIHVETIPFMSYPAVEKPFKIITKATALWDHSRQEALERGNICHYLLSKIKDASDVDEVILDAFESGIISLQQREPYYTLLHAIVNHNALKEYYISSKYTIHNERDIYSTSGEVIRPDRIAVYNNSAVIIDYKTGSFHTRYVEQLQGYAKIIAEMNITVKARVLVFINDTIKVMAV